MSNIAIGQKAPDFKLVGIHLDPIILADYKGKNLILHFFPLAFSSVCTAQMCTANEPENEYSQLNAEVLGVSVDSPFVLQKFGQENNLKFTLGSDYNRVVSKAYDVLYEDDFLGMTHFSKRAAFVIDTDGIIQYAEVVTDGKSLPNFENIKNAIAQCQKND